MIRKGFFVLVLTVLAAGGVFAQTWYDRYADGIDENILFVNAGVGFGPTGGYSMGIPPISVSVDFKLPIDLPITVGAGVTFTTWKYSISQPFYNLDVTYMNIGFGGRGMYHFNFMENLDTYAGLTFGYVLQKATVEASNEYGQAAADAGASFFLWGINIGARYFFTDYIGAYLELGYSGLQYASIGVSVKF
jgi:hypothetical protein